MLSRLSLQIGWLTLCVPNTSGDTHLVWRKEHADEKGRRHYRVTARASTGKAHTSREEHLLRNAGEGSG